MSGRFWKSTVGRSVVLSDGDEDTDGTGDDPRTVVLSDCFVYQSRGSYVTDICEHGIPRPKCLWDAAYELESERDNVGESCANIAYRSAPRQGSPASPVTPSFFGAKGGPRRMRSALWAPTMTTSNRRKLGEGKRRKETNDYALP